jgi:hypothetical protein
MSKENLSAAEALEKLKDGNKRYLSAAANTGDISPYIRKMTCEEGQTLMRSLLHAPIHG